MNRTAGLAAFCALAVACQDAPERSDETRLPPSGETAGDRSADQAASTVPFAGAARRSGPAPACASGEAVLFACPVGNGKRVAVCDVGGAAVYRFGGDDVELELTGGRIARTGYSGGGEVQIAFTNQGYDHIVYSRTVRTGAAGEPNDPAMSDGLIVARGDSVVTTKLCASEPEADFEAASAILPRGARLFEPDGGRTDR